AEMRRRLGKVTREEQSRLRERVVARLGRERTALGYVDTYSGIALAERVGDVRGADVRSSELQPAELIERAAEMEREPAARAEASVTEQQAIAFEIAAEVGECRPRDLVRDPSSRVEAAHVDERREVHVRKEIASQRRGLGNWARQFEGRVSAHIRDEGVVRALQRSPRLRIRLRRWPRREDLVAVAFIDGEALEDRGQVRTIG